MSRITFVSLFFFSSRPPPVPLSTPPPYPLSPLLPCCLALLSIFSRKTCAPSGRLYFFHCVQISSFYHSSRVAHGGARKIEKISERHQHVNTLAQDGTQQNTPCCVMYYREGSTCRPGIRASSEGPERLRSIFFPSIHHKISKLTPPRPNHRLPFLPHHQAYCRPSPFSPHATYNQTGTPQVHQA